MEKRDSDFNMIFINKSAYFYITFTLTPSHLDSIPLFIGVSKTSRHRKSLYATLTKMLSNKQYEQEMKQHLIETIQRIERENAGVVPPAFVKK
mgnify:CR=1 FL=1